MSLAYPGTVRGWRKRHNHGKEERVSPLRELEQLAARIETAEGKVDELRVRRNSLIHTAVAESKATERQAATAARVSNAYAHRCVAGAGDPGSGTKR